MESVTRFKSTDLPSMANFNRKIDEANALAQYLESHADTKGIVQAGSYVGTGTYGAANPSTLTFDFAPALLIVSQHELYYANLNSQFVLFMQMLGTEYTNINFHGSQYSDYLKRSADGKTLSWYSTVSVTAQYNEPTSYNWIAIG